MGAIAERKSLVWKLVGGGLEETCRPRTASTHQCRSTNTSEVDLQVDLSLDTNQEWSSIRWMFGPNCQSWFSSYLLIHLDSRIKPDLLPYDNRHRQHFSPWFQQEKQETQNWSCAPNINFRFKQQSWLLCLTFKWAMKRKQHHSVCVWMRRATVFHLPAFVSSNVVLTQPYITTGCLDLLCCKPPIRSLLYMCMLYLINLSLFVLTITPSVPRAWPGSEF